MLDAEPGEGAAHLGELGPVGIGARRRRDHRPARAVRVESAGNAVSLEYGLQRRHDGGDALAALHKLGVEHVLGGVIDNDERGVIGVRHEGQPAMAAAVEMQQFAETRPGLPTSPMPPARPARADQVRSLQGLLHERVGHRHPVLAARDLIEVPHVEARVAITRAVAVAIERQQPLHLRHRHRPGRGV